MLVLFNVFEYIYIICIITGNYDYPEGTASNDGHSTLYLIEDEGDVDKIIGTQANGTPYAETLPVHDDDNDSISSGYINI